MTDRYPGYDVLSKRNSLSWNDQTRAVIDARLAIDKSAHLFFTDAEWATLCAVCARVVPQPVDRQRPAPIAAMVDTKMAADSRDGYRDARLPPMREAWRRGLAALDAEARMWGEKPLHELVPLAQDDVLAAVQEGKAHLELWGDMPPAVFFTKRLLHDIVSAYYAWPDAWSEIGFGGPTGPRGYVRMNFNRRDPWEASEARPGREEKARRENERVG